MQRQYNEYPEKMTVFKYGGLTEYEQSMYNTKDVFIDKHAELGDIKYYKKFSQYEHEEILRKQAEIDAEIKREFQERLSQSHCVITENEYNMLPPDKHGFEWNSDYDMKTNETTYIKGRSYVEIEEDNKNRLDEIVANPNIELSEREYLELPSNIISQFRWIKEPPCYNDYTYFRKRTNNDDKMDRRKIIENEINNLYSTRSPICTSEKNILIRGQFNNYYYTVNVSSRIKQLENQLNLGNY
jgi:hypothetical protein